MTITNTVTTILANSNGTIKMRENTTTIVRGTIQRKFYCGHCGAIFITTNYNKTKHGHSAFCPCCPYRAWSK